MEFTHLDSKSSIHLLIISQTVHQFSLISMSNWLDNINKKIFPQTLLPCFLYLPYNCLRNENYPPVYHPMLHTHPSGNFLEITLNVDLIYKSTVTLTTLILLICEQRICLHFLDHLKFYSTPFIGQCANNSQIWLNLLMFIWALCYLNV